VRYTAWSHADLGSEAAAPPRPSDARERILETAYELFSQHGIRAVGVDAVVEGAGVAKMTLWGDCSTQPLRSSGCGRP
jgi:hypothetical protein